MVFANTRSIIHEPCSRLWCVNKVQYVVAVCEAIMSWSSPRRCVVDSCGCLRGAHFSS